MQGDGDILTHGCLNVHGGLPMGDSVSKVRGKRSTSKSGFFL